MYICICNAVNENTINAAIADGASTLRELSAVTGVATSCGKCATEAMRILEQATKSKPSSTLHGVKGHFPPPALTVVA